MNNLKKAFTGISAILVVLVAVIPAQAQIISTPVVHVDSSEPVTTCLTINHSLFIGSRDANTDGEVTSLQNFLRAHGYLNSQATGYFGTMTFAGVRAFQRDNNISAIGVVGPTTRSHIYMKTCGDPSGPKNIPTITSLSPQSGPIGTVVTISGQGFTPTETIKFGTGAITQVTYVNQNTLTVTIPSYIGQYCAPGMMCTMIAMQVQPSVYQVSVINSDGTQGNQAPFTVTSGQTATAQIISSVNPTSAPVGAQVFVTGTGFDTTTYVWFKSSTTGGVDVKPTLVNSSNLSFIVPQAFQAPVCANILTGCGQAQLVLPGNYTVQLDKYVTSTADLIDQTSNIVNFTVTPSSTNSGPLSITGLDIPSSLPIYTTGTWTMHMSISNVNTNLHYSVVWGDEVGGTAITVQNSATFTHQYGRTGTFTPQFTVTDDYGHSATTSATVIVTPIY